MNEVSQVKVTERPRSDSYELYVLVVTIFALLVAAGLLLLPARSPLQPILYWLDFILCALLFIDFLSNLRRAPNKLSYLVRGRGWLELLGTIPAIPGMPWTALLRLARLDRLVQIVRRLQGRNRAEVWADARQVPARTVMLTTILMAIMLMTVVSLLVLRVERHAPDAHITTGADAFWWAIVTMTTVGYGDLVPVTHTGRLLAILLMTFGIGVFAVLTSFVASRLVTSAGEQDDKLDLLMEENAMIRAELAEIKALLMQPGSSGGGDS